MDAFERWWAGQADNILPEYRAMVKAAWRFAFMAGVGAERERLTPRWSKAAPSAPGWYWWRSPGCAGVEMLEVVKACDNTLITMQRMGGGNWVSRMGGEWCGPLPVPGE